MLDPALLLLYSNILSTDDICNIAIYPDDSTLYSKCVEASDFWKYPELGSKLEFDLWCFLNLSTKQIVDFSARKAQVVLFDHSNINGAIYMKISGSNLIEKPSCEMLDLRCWSTNCFYY